jgi:hypothetical protein
MDAINDLNRKQRLVELEEHILNLKSELSVDGLLVCALDLILNLNLNLILNLNFEFKFNVYFFQL